MDKIELAKYINKLRSIVNPETMQGISHDTVIDYYSKSAFFYKKFHSPNGAMHLPIVFSKEKGQAHDHDLLYHARTIEEVIQKNGFKHVLELGCGMGFNSVYLAKNNPTVSFHAMDLTEFNLSFARKKSAGLDNIKFSQGDFDNPNSIEGKYDLIFAIETLCHSGDISNLLSHVSEKLSDDGKLIIFDGYFIPENEAQMDNLEIQAQQLLTWGFALERFQNLQWLLQLNPAIPLTLESKTDYTENILPNFRTFQKAAKRALNNSFLLSVLYKLRILPLAFLKQLGAGLTAPYLVDQGYFGYYKLVFNKKSKP